MTHLQGQHSYSAVRRDLAARPRTWLVTGAAGFIGSNLVQELMALGQRVVGFDNLSTGFLANIDDVLSSSKASRGSLNFIEGDIRDLDALLAASKGVDYVLHQAALASVPRSIVDPISSSQVNVEGFLNVLVAARDASASRVVYASSSSVYGDATALPQVEETTGNVLSPYAATKAANEMYAKVFQRNYGLETVGLRYFNVFGPRQDPNGAYAAVVPRWVAKLLAGERCEVYGDGETTRDFCYVANAVQANILAATTTTEGATGRAYNIACGATTSLNELFQVMRSGLSAFHPSVANATPEYAPARQGDIRHSLADIGAARALLGYEPTHLAADGLREALTWYATQLLSESGAGASR